MVNGQLREMVEQTDLSHWKSALAIICTYAKREEFAVLSGIFCLKIRVNFLQDYWEIVSYLMAILNLLFYVIYVQEM